MNIDYKNITWSKQNMNSKVICLANIEQATQQEIFDQVVAHHRKQRRISLAPDESCVYRSAEGFKCFAGALIADDEYKPMWEGSDADLIGVFKHHGEFIRTLQRCHDSGAVEPYPDFQVNAERRLEALAIGRGLVYTPESSEAV